MHATQAFKETARAVKHTHGSCMWLQIMGAMRRLRLQGWHYRLELCCVEVYNNSVRDLLDAKGQDIKDMNAIKHDPQGVAAVTSGLQYLLPYTK